MYKNIFIIKWIGIIIVYQNFHQCTTNDEHNITTLEPQNVTEQQHHQPKPKPKPIPCGIEYLNETIGLSITNNHLYQFLLINDTIEIIRYDNRKLSKNNYKLNLIDGHMLVNGLEDLIPLDIVKRLITIIQWTDGDNNQHSADNDNNNEPPILSITMSMYKHEKIHIYCIKSFDQITYNIGEYNQIIDNETIEAFLGKHDEQKIMGTISNENDGLLLLLYDKLSYSLVMLKLKKNYYANSRLEWTKTFVVDSSLNFLYEIYENITEHEQQQILTKSFSKIFGPHTFTFGFVDDNRIYLFSNQDERIISFASDFIQNTNKNYSDEKYPFNIQSYQDFFYCDKTFVDNGFNISTTIMGIIAASIIVFILLIVLFVCCLRKKSGKKNPVKKLPLTSSPPKQKINLDGKSDSSILSPATTTTTMTKKSVSSSSMLSKTSTTTTSKMSEKLLPLSSISKTSTTTSKVSGKSTPRSSISKTSTSTSKVSGKSSPPSKISKTPAATTSKVSGKLSPRSKISKTTTTNDSKPWLRS